MAPGAGSHGDCSPGRDWPWPDRWRREIRVGTGFAEVLIAPVGDGAGCPAPLPIEIEFAGKARVRIPADATPAGLASAVVKALSGR